MMFMDEAAKKWYKQSVMSKNSDSNGLIDLFYGYDSLFDTNIPATDIDGVFTGDENT